MENNKESFNPIKIENNPEIIKSPEALEKEIAFIEGDIILKQKEIRQKELEISGLKELILNQGIESGQDIIENTKNIEEILLNEMHLNNRLTKLSNELTKLKEDKSNLVLVKQALDDAMFKRIIKD